MLKQQYDAKRLILRQSCPQLAQAAADYLKRNRDFLAPFEPVRLPEYFSLPFWQTQMEQDARQARQGQGYRFWLFLPERPEQLIGMAHLSQISRGCFQSCYLGYHMDQQFLRQGYMTEALERVLSLAFEPLGLHRVEANVMPSNAPSLALLKKLGFHQEGLALRYLKIQGQWEDHLHMAKLADDPENPMPKPQS